MSSSFPAWHALESNPDVMSEFVQRLGVSAEWAFTDVWGLDDDLLGFVPQPVLAVMLLFPVTENYEKFRKEEHDAKVNNAENISAGKDAYFFRQTIRNACGFIGVLHALANNDRSLLGLQSGPLVEFLDKTRHATPEERCRMLSESKELAESAKQAAHQGQTETPAIDAKIDSHFVCFVNHRGRVLELDGSKMMPIDHGVCRDLLKDSVGVIRQFMQRDPSEVKFTVMVLAPKPE